MLCSNCRVIEIRFESRRPVTCENGHYLCGKCILEMNDRCILCEGQMFDDSGNMWKCLQGGESQTWTSEMMRKWSIQDELPETYTLPNNETSLCVLPEEGDKTATNLIYSTREGYQVESLNNNDPINISGPSWEQPVVWNHFYPKLQDCTKRNIPLQKRFVKLGCGQDRATINIKEPHHQLLAETKEELQAKIMEEICSTFKNDPISDATYAKLTNAKQFQTIGVSTESTPKLLAENNIRSMEQSKESMGTQTKSSNIAKMRKVKQDTSNVRPAECLVKDVETSDSPNRQIINELKKDSSSDMDLRLQRVMETIFESVPEEALLLLENQNFYKFIQEKFSSMPLTKLREIMSSVFDERVNSSPSQVCPHHQRELLPQPSTNLSLTSNSRRAFYNPPSTQQANLTPTAQFQPLSFNSLDDNDHLYQMKAIDAATLNIPRSPVICPISNCQRAFFVSDFTKHMAVDHTKIPKKSISPSQCKNFILDPKFVDFGVSRCQVLLLVSDKIKNLGHDKFKDFVPILVMATKVSLLELCCSEYRPHSEEVQNSTQNFVMIWLTGLVPPQLPIFFSLTVWARSGVIPTCHIVHSGRLYSVRNAQSPEAIRRSGQMVLLSENQIDLLTNNGRRMLELQVAIH